MSRNSLQFLFTRAAQEVIPPGIEAKVFAPGVLLHPLIENGATDNSKTVFGLITPVSHGKTMIVQVAADTEKLIAQDNPTAIDCLRRDLSTAVEFWQVMSVPHILAWEKIVKL